MKEQIKKARAFAIQAHADQQYGGDPYVVHLDEVASILDEFGHSAAIISGYLHDVLEDTEIRFEELLKHFGEDVAKVVQFCSDEPGNNRKERKRLTYDRMRRDIDSGANWVPLAIQTKVADRLANIRASQRNNPELLKMYQKEWPQFCQSLRTPGVCDAMWNELQSLCQTS